MANLKYKHTAYTSAQWASLNPVIVENEIVIESDTKRTKIGNGISTYNQLGYADANSVGNSLGSIKPTDAAPTPARNGNYTFSIGGNKPAWLTAEAGITEVKAGDGVAVVYDGVSAYTYTHVKIDRIADVYNVTVENPLAAGQYYTPTTARAAVPTINRAKGKEITYETSAGVWVNEKFVGSDVANWTVDVNWVNLDKYISKIHPFERDLSEFSTAIGSGWFTEVDNWFDGDARKFASLNIRSTKASYVSVAFFTITGSTSTLIAQQNVLLAVGVNSLSIEQIITDINLIERGTKYYIFVQNLSTCVSYSAGNNKGSMYISTTNLTTVVLQSYKFSFWITTIDDVSLTEQQISYLYRKPIAEFDIITELANNDYVFIPPGTHFVNSKISIKSGQTIEGVYGKSILKFETALPISVELINVSNILLRNFTIIGTDPNTPIEASQTGSGLDVSAGIIDTLDAAISKTGMGTHNGVHIYNVTGLTVENIEVGNFNGFGIWARMGSSNYFKSSNYSNIFTHDCFVGFSAQDSLEYASFVAIRSNRNQIGLIIDAGNNSFTNCHIDGNRVGLVLLGGSNSAHGSICASTFNHNTLYGVIVSSVLLAESFTGCQFWHGDVYLKNSTGILINGGIFGSMHIYADGIASGGGVCLITDSIFRLCTITHDYINPSNLKLKNNYKLDGTDPSLFNN